MRALAALFALVALAVAGVAPPAFAETTVDANGVKWVCEDGVCRIVGDEPSAASAPDALSAKPARLVLGYRDAGAFLAFLSGGETAAHDAFGSFTWLTLLLVLVGGLALNLTPCVLPMIPVNLIVIGKSPVRGLAYGLGMALAYGALGVLAAVGGLAFGTIQSSAWFNGFVAVVFALLGLSLLGLFPIDLTRFRPGAVRLDGAGTALAAFFLGALSAVLAGACVAPVLISVLLLTSRLYAGGHVAALALPFALGVGMALPWPFLGAGLRVLPRPGGWMKAVNRLFALVVFCFAAWYARLAWIGVRGGGGNAAGGAIPGAVEATPRTFAQAFADARAAGKPILVDCWASWCKNCAAMERTTLAEPRVREALVGFSVIRLEAEDPTGLRALAPFEDVIGLPAFAIFDAP
ncbi:MAG: thioredoxin family protein [Kiritimatiellae bacterium]|nr:thioredoxin family protein [Kiritimatiellia bacterium]